MHIAVKIHTTARSRDIEFGLFWWPFSKIKPFPVYIILGYGQKISPPCHTTIFREFHSILKNGKINAEYLLLFPLL